MQSTVCKEFIIFGPAKARLVCSAWPLPDIWFSLTMITFFMFATADNFLFVFDHQIGESDSLRIKLEREI